VAFSVANGYVFDSYSYAEFFLRIYVFSYRDQSSIEWKLSADVY